MIPDCRWTRFSITRSPLASSRHDNGFARTPWRLCRAGMPPSTSTAVASRLHVRNVLAWTVRVIAWTGWRLREVASLEWRNVDLAGQTLRLDASRSKNKKPLSFPYGSFPAFAAALREQRE